MRTFCIKSLGCKQNQLEGQIIQNELEQLGYKQVSLEKADIYVLNSCTVTSHSDSQVRYLLNNAKRKNPKIKTILTGCTAQTYKLHKNFDYSDIDLILGNKEKINIENYINKLFEKENICCVQDIFTQTDFENKFLINPKSTRVSVKIQDGCNNRCSYCIIPYARGNSRSNSLENIINQIDLISKKGIKEIVLTGIHIGQWGLEFNKTLLDLLKEIEKTDIARYRLGSLYIDEISDEMIDFLKSSKKFCPHFHLSLQSLSTSVLGRMNRRYSADEAMKLIQKLHNNFDLPYLGCDIIVGFPEETDEEFENTYENLKLVKLSSIHCFPYSKRENTPAFNMKNQVQNNIKTKRAKLISELSEKLHKEFLNKNKNKKAEILIERKSPKTGLYSAVTRNYIKVYIKDDLNNLQHSLKIVDLSDFELM